MTSAQIKKLPLGEYTNLALNRIDSNHCRPYKAKPEYQTFLKGKDTVTGLKNRQQRRKKL